MAGNHNSGRKRKPTGTNAGNVPPRPNEPKPPIGIPDPPDWLNKEAKAIYSRIADTAFKMGIMTVADGDLVALLADALADLAQARRIINKEGPVIQYEGSKGQMVYKAHPALYVANQAYQRARPLMSELGLTPAARARLQTTQDIDNAEEEAKQMFGF